MPIYIKGIKYLSVAEASQEYAYTEYYIRSLARKWALGKPGGLRGIKRGRAWFFSTKDLNVRFFGKRREQ